MGLKDKLTSAAILLGIVNPAYDRPSGRKEEGEGGRRSTEDFVHAATLTTLFCVQSAHLATQRAHTESILVFAKGMIERETKRGRTLGAAAAEEGVTELPEEVDSARAQKLMDLSTTSAADFERRYVLLQIAELAEAVALFEDQAGMMDGPSRLAAAAAPQLRDSLADIVRIKRSLWGD